ncbi:MAG: WXG100 family type VII secretion target [Anaerolineales bacterium]
MPSIKIQCHYDQSTQVVNIFKNQQSSVSQMMNKLKSAKEELSGGKWIGKGAKAFYSEFDQKLLPAMKALDHAMEGGATTITKASKTMQKAEDEAKNIFIKVDISFSF